MTHFRRLLRRVLTALRKPWRLLGRSRRRIAHLERLVDGLREARDFSRSEHERAKRERDQARSWHAEAKRQRDEGRAQLRALREERANAPFRWWSQVEDLRSTGGEPLDVLHFHPPLMHNPVLLIWYSRMAEAGFDARPLRSIETLSGQRPTVFHLHWVRLVRRIDDDEAVARATAERVIEGLNDFVERGGTLLWTVHEALSHDTRFADIEASMRGRIAEMAHGIHLLHGSTLEAIGDLYPVEPRKTFVVQQPFYVGYPDYVTRRSARRLLGLSDDAVVLLAFGAIRPYKGFDRVVRLLPRLRAKTGKDVRLIIAGPVLDPAHAAELRRLVAATEGATMADGPVDRDNVQFLFRASDLAVLPYRAIHNSGSVMLDLVFGIPTIAPRNPVLSDVEGSGMVRLFEGESDEDLVRVIAEAIGDPGSFGKELSAEFAALHDPQAVALEFARRVRLVADRPHDWWESA